MDKRAYWIWVRDAFGAGSRKPYEIYKKFSGGLEEFYAGGAALWNSMAFVSEKEARMLFTRKLEEAQAHIEYCEKLGHKLITPECEKYPDALRNIFDPPAVIYYKGKLPDVDNKPAIGIVGPRKAGKASVDAAMTISYQLALSDAIVVSGIAVGVDIAAHKGAMKGMGKTVCVLPCGLNNGYLIENYHFREKIANTGAVITEYPADTGVTKGTFQVRNRLISGLSCGLLVIGAKAKSGSLITARLAVEQGRDVFVFSGDVKDAEAEGSHALLKDGAKSVYNSEDILEEYRHRFYQRTKAAQNPEKEDENISQEVQEEQRVAAPVLADSGTLPENISDDAICILKLLGFDWMSLSELLEVSKLSSPRVLSSMTELELLGLAKSGPGRKYKRI